MATPTNDPAAATPAPVAERMIPASLVDRLLSVQELFRGPLADPEVGFGALCSLAQEFVGAEGAAVGLATDLDLIYPAASGVLHPLQGIVVPREAGLSGSVVRTGTMVCVEDLQGDPRAVHATRLPSVRGALFLPLAPVKGVVGVLALGSTVERAFGPVEIGLAQLVARSVSSLVATEQMRLRFQKLAGERLKLAFAVSEREALLDNFFTSYPDPMGVMEPHESDVTYLRVNRAAAAVLGLSPEQMAGRRASELGIPSAALTLWIDAATEAARSRAPVVVSYETPTSGRQGRGVPLVRGIVFPLSGHANQFCFATQDLSEIATMRQQLATAERQATVGILAAGVAHEVNNPLSFIISNLAFIESELRGKAAHQEAAEAATDAREGAVRISKIAHALLEYARPSEPALQRIQLSRPVGNAVQLARTQLNHVPSFSVNVPELEVITDPPRLTQVLLNLLLNAAHAVEHLPHSERSIALTASRDENRNIVIQVADNGAGIAPELLARIFDPFFTTKPAGKGTGLGLAVCKQVVTALGGEITVSSRPGAGSTFDVVIPAGIEHERV